MKNVNNSESIFNRMQNENRLHFDIWCKCSQFKT